MTHKQMNQDLLETLRRTLNQKAPLRTFEPFTDYSFAGSVQNQVFGKQLIEEGKVACLLVAGGMGTRLRSPGPKGVIPVSAIKQKSLFQLFAEKTLAAGKNLPLAIMTSGLNDQATRQFFSENHYFGLSCLSFFQQGSLPILNTHGDYLLDREGKIQEGPDGNGLALHHLIESGIFKEWEKKGVRYVNFILVDNPLADPFDAELIGTHARANASLTAKCILRENSSEKVGLFVKVNGKAEVVEYSEIGEAENSMLDEKGELKHRCANLSMFCFSMDFIQEVGEKKLPLHPASKAIASINNPHPIAPNAWKFVYFIFDVLPFAKKVQALIYDRKDCFSPLKNEKGSHSLESVKWDLIEKDKAIYSKISGLAPPTHIIELSQKFYYPDEALLKRWRGKKIKENEHYIEE